AGPAGPARADARASSPRTAATPRSARVTGASTAASVALTEGAVRRTRARRREHEYESQTTNSDEPHRLYLHSCIAGTGSQAGSVKGQCRDSSKRLDFRRIEVSGRGPHTSRSFWYPVIAHFFELCRASCRAHLR